MVNWIASLIIVIGFLVSTSVIHTFRFILNEQLEEGVIDVVIVPPYFNLG